MSLPERILWSMLRDRRLGGLKFRRQYPIDRYIVDYYCAEAKLVVELDGESHTGHKAEDEKPQSVICSYGLNVIRMTNGDLIKNKDAVATYIARAAGLAW